MKNQFVTYKIALKLKELGFNEKCIATFDEDENFELQNFEQNYDTFPSHIIAAPLWQQVIEWLDNKDIHIIIYFPQSISGCVGIISTIENSMLLVGEIGTIWKNRIDFYEAAILKAIKIINH